MIVGLVIGLFDANSNSPIQFTNPFANPLPDYPITRLPDCSILLASPSMSPKVTRREFIGTAVGTERPVGAGASGLRSAAKRPHVLSSFADDLGYGDLSARPGRRCVRGSAHR